MNPVSPQVLDADTPLALDELVAASGLPREVVVELIEWGAFEPLPGQATMFRSVTLVAARRAARLRQTFLLDTSGLALALAYLDRIDRLEARVRELECSAPR
jgi:chaperone modulatory protein CbpM